eukprot:gene21434-27465_t
MGRSADGSAILTPHGDAQIQVQGDMSMSSATTSFSVAGGHCSYFYSKQPGAVFSPVGNVVVAFPNNQNSASGFGLSVDFQDTNYDKLRRVYWDLSSKLEANSSVKFDCAFTLSAKVYGIVPITVTIPFSDSVKIRDSQENPTATGGPETTNAPKISMAVRDFSTSKVELDIIIKLSKNMKAMLNVGHKPIESFVINLPKISYATSLVDKTTNAQSYIRLRSHAQSFDLATFAPIVLDIKASCIPVTVEGDAAPASCSLLANANLNQFRSELSNHKFVNITAKSLEESFVSSFLGEYHFIKSVDSADYPELSSVPEESHRQLVSLQSTDPSISTGGNCVTVDSDGVYVSQVCSIIEGGFFKLYMIIFDSDGYIGYLNSAISWATAGEVAFSGMTFGSIVSGGVTSTIFGDTFFSQNQQNLSLVLGYNSTSPSSQKTMFLEALKANWDFTSTTGLFNADSLTLINGLSPYRASANLEYGDDLYSTAVKVSDNVMSNTGDLLTVAGNGSYGGNWNEWHFTLDESELVYDSSLIGHATGAVQYDVPSNPIDGVLALNFDVTDNKDRVVTSSNYNVLSWETNSQWNDAGTVAVVSLYDLYDGETETLSWNATGVFDYADNQYTLYAVENPEDAQSDDTTPLAALATVTSKNQLAENKQKTISQGAALLHRALSAISYNDQFLVFGAGAFSCSLTDGFVSLTQSSLVVDQSYIGAATGAVAYIARNNDGSVVFNANATDANNNQVLTTLDSVKWTTSDNDWIDAGAITVSSVLLASNNVNWNASLGFDYGDNLYSIAVQEQDYEASINDDAGWQVEWFAVSGQGGYGGSSASNWWASLTESEFIYSHSIIGYAVGAVTLWSSAQNGGLSVSTNVVNVNQVLALALEDSLAWTSVDDAWTESGNIQVVSSLYVQTSVNYNASAQFKYGSNQYHIAVVEDAYVVPGAEHDDNNALDNFNVFANGGYGGASWSNWWTTLEQSTLVYAHNLIGSALGRVTFLGTNGNTDGTFNLFGRVLDSHVNTVINTTQIIGWTTNSQWVDQGTVTVVSSAVIPGTMWYNATIGGTFDEGQYSFDFDEFDSFASNGDDQSDLDDDGHISDHIQCFGEGVYAGSWSDWFMQLTEGTVLYNNALVGTASGDINGVTPDSWYEGYLTYNTLTRNKFSDMVLTTNGSLSWQSPEQSTYLGRGAFRLISQVNCPAVANWNASASFSYGDNLYHLNVVEQNLIGEAPAPHFITFVQGAYGAPTPTNVYLSITDSLVELNNVVYANVRGYFSVDTDSSGKNGLAIVNLVDYNENQQSAMAVGETYPTANSELWSQNVLSWYYVDPELTGGYLYTNTSLQAASLFTAYSKLNVSLYADSATFLLRQTLNGEDGVLASAAATYDMSSGMIAELSADVNYQDKLLFGFNTNYDAQTETIDNSTPGPSVAPSVAPSAVPSVAPSASPSTVLPSVSPTVQPTLLPGQTYAPSEAPTMTPTAPTVAPSVQPSAVPTLLPSGVPSLTTAPSVLPSRAPTIAPSVAPTTAAVQFSASQGINITTFNSQLTANTNALLSSIAQCMTGVGPSNIQGLVVSAGARRLTEKLNLRVVSVRVLATSSGSVVASYVVATNAAGASYSDLSTQLSTNVANGQFNSYLTTATVAYGGSPALATSTSDSVATTNLVSGGSNNDNSLSTGATVGIAVGCAGFVVLIFGLAYFFMYKKSSSSDGAPLAKSSASSSSSSGPATAQPIDSGKVPSTGPNFTENPVMTQQKRTSSLNRDTSTSAPRSPLVSEDNTPASPSGKRGSSEANKRASHAAIQADNNL